MCTNSTYRWGHTEGDEQNPRTESEKLRPSLAHVCVCQVINNSMFLGGLVHGSQKDSIWMCCYSPPPEYACTCKRTYCVSPVFWPGLLSVLREEQQIVIYCIAICLTAAALGVGFCSVVILMNSLFFVSYSKWPLPIVCVHLVLDMKV